MSVNLSAWRFIDDAETVISEYMLANLGENVRIAAALTADAISAPSVSVRNSSVRPYTDAAPICAHTETTTAITVRTSMDSVMDGSGRENHIALCAAVMGVIMVVDETTGENALPSELNALANGRCGFSMAAWSGRSGGIDEENRHFVTRIELNCIINPPQVEE